jgi:general secretion pathway protein D
MEIISSLDVPPSKEEVAVIALKYASAEVLSEQITRIMDEGSGTSATAGRTGTISTVQPGRKILPDTRTNSIIVVANPQDTEIIEALAMQLDVERPRGANNVHVVYLENASAKETAESLTAALANLRITGGTEANQQPVQVTADVGTNSLIITASAQDYEVIAEIIEKLDIVREQVLVEMLIMEISEDSLREIGIDWQTLDEAVADSVRGFASTNFGPRVDFVSGDYEGLAVGGWRADGDEVGIGAILSALEKVSGVNILSTPHIMTSNHNPATILVGENRAFVGQSRITDTDPATPTVIRTFEYRDVGISLEITPHISQGGLVKLEISSEFSKVIEDVTSVSADTPTTSQRQATTTITMNDGSTVVIGGLIRDDKTTSEKKIPFVGDIPVVGNLFKFQRERLEKTNLLMFITPRVVSSAEQMQQITEYKRNEMKSANGGGILEQEDRGTDN